MKRYILTIIAISALIFLMKSEITYACTNELPVAGSDDTYKFQTVGVYYGDTFDGKKAYLNGSDSYDTDGSIATWRWEVYKWDGYSTFVYYNQYYEFDHPVDYITFWESGCYRINLRVKDNEGDWCSDDNTDYCVITVCEAYMDDVYAAYGKSNDLIYGVMPEPYYLWPYGDIYISLNLYDSQYNHIFELSDDPLSYDEDHGNLYISDYETYTWNGKGNVDSYNDVNLPVGYYYMYIATGEYNDFGNSNSYTGWFECWWPPTTLTVFNAQMTLQHNSIYYGTGMNFNYQIGPNTMWWADGVELEIYNAQNQVVFYNWWYSIYAFSNHTYTWNGKGNYGSYNNNYLPAGTYKARLRVWVGNNNYETPLDSSHTFTVSGVKIDAPASFPAYWAIDSNALNLGCTPLADSNGASYSWSKVSGPGDVNFSSSTARNPTFESNQPGNYTVKVQYTKNGVTSTDTSGVITVYSVVIQNNPPDRDTPTEIGYAADANIYYKIEPSTGWTPDSVSLIIKRQDTNEIVNTLSLSTAVGEQMRYWDGNDLNNVHLDPNTYRLELKVSKGGEPNYTIALQNLTVTSTVENIGTWEWIAKDNKWDIDNSDKYIPIRDIDHTSQIDGTITIYAKSNPYNGQVCFGNNMPTWEISSVPAGANKAGLTLTPGQSIRCSGGNDMVTIGNITVPGVYTVRAYTYSNVTFKQITIVAVQTDLIINGYSETAEAAGVYIKLNDLVKIDFSFGSNDTNYKDKINLGKVTLKGAVGYNTYIKIWKDQNKTEEFTLPKTWDLTNQNEKTQFENGVYVEGISKYTGNSESLILSYEPPQSSSSYGSQWYYDEVFFNVAGYKVTITEIKNLYKVDATHANGYYSSGYTSKEDDKGRIYSNAEFNSSSPDNPTWSAYQNYIELTVTVDTTSGLGNYPYILWEYIDVDDPSNDGLSAADGYIIDPGDYVSGYNKNGGDNNGTAYWSNGNIAEYNGIPTPWECIDSPTDTYSFWDKHDGTAETYIVGGISKVSFIAQNSGGDNYIIKVTLFDNDGNKIACDQTGIMTVWKRIDLERTQMYCANTLDCSSLNDSVAMAFVEFVDPTVIYMRSNKYDHIGSDYYMSTSDLETAKSMMKNYVEAPFTGEFDNAGQGGWYFLGSAGYLIPEDSATKTRLINPATDGYSIVLYDSVNNVDVLQLPKEITSGVPHSVTIWKDLDEYNKHDSYGHTGTQYVSLTCQFDPGYPDRLYFPQNCLPNYQPVEDKFTFYPADFYDMGFNVNENVVAEIWTAGAIVWDGWSPETANNKFQGRTLVFKTGGKSTISHELVHGLGMAHNCGNADYTGENTCFMTYDFWPLFDQAGNLPKWGRKNAGLKLCSEHIIHIRQTHLEETSTSRQLNW
jgi:hypothetical protein